MNWSSDQTGLLNRVCDLNPHGDQDLRFPPNITKRGKKYMNTNKWIAYKVVTKKLEFIFRYRLKNIFPKISIKRI